MANINPLLPVQQLPLCTVAKGLRFATEQFAICEQSVSITWMKDMHCWSEI